MIKISPYTGVFIYFVLATVVTQNFPFGQLSNNLRSSLVFVCSWVRTYWNTAFSLQTYQYIHNPTHAQGQEAWIMPEDGGADQGRGCSPEVVQAEGWPRPWSAPPSEGISRILPRRACKIMVLAGLTQSFSSVLKPLR